MTMAAAALLPVDRVVDALTALGCNPRRSGSGYSARCPVAEAHKRGDRNPSLSVGESPSGKCLVYCHAGCTAPQIAGALGLAMADLFPDEAPKVAHIGANGQTKAVYTYTDELGEALYEIVKFTKDDRKTFRPRRPGATSWGIGDTRRVVYNLPQVTAAVTEGRPVVVCEGEKDAESASWMFAEIRAATTCNPFGAGKWTDAYDATFANATVWIVADDDPPGRAHALDVAAHLTTVATSVQMWLPAPGFKDLSEMWGANRGMEALRHWKPTEQEWAAEPDERDWGRRSIVDAQGEIMEPTVLSLFYPGRINQLFGESGTGKTWIGLAAVAETVRAGRNALIVDYEDDVRYTAVRLRALGLGNDELARVDYRSPTTALGSADAVEGLADVLADLGVVVIDSTGEAMAAGGVDSNSDVAVARWFQLVEEFCHLDGSPAVVLNDHIPKAFDAPSAFAIGSQRKRAAVTGASYRVDVITAPAIGTDGKLKLTVAKDRPGNFKRGAVAAEVDFKSMDDGAVVITLNKPAGTANVAGLVTFRPTVLMERVSRWLELNPDASRRSIRAEVRGKERAVMTALDVLVEEGWVDVSEGERGARAHRVVHRYREFEDSGAPGAPLVPSGARAPVGGVVPPVPTTHPLQGWAPGHHPTAPEAPSESPLVVPDEDKLW